MIVPGRGSAPHHPPKPKKRFNPRIEIFSAFHSPFAHADDKVIDIGLVDKAAACCACTACTACR